MILIGYCETQYIYIYTADECSVDYDPHRKLCDYYAYVEPPVMGFPQFVPVGYCKNTPGSFEVCALLSSIFLLVTQ
jgi:hypothetical protein